MLSPPRLGVLEGSSAGLQGFVGFAQRGTPWLAAGLRADRRFGSVGGWILGPCPAVGAVGRGRGKHGHDSSCIRAWGALLSLGLLVPLPGNPFWASGVATTIPSDQEP